MPVAESTPVDELKPSLGGMSTVLVERHANRYDRGHDRRARRVRGERAGAEDDAVQQRAMR